MTGIVHAPIGDVGDSLTILDAGRRLYAALSRDGSYWHIVAPVQADVVGNSGEVLRATGELSCTCKGGLRRGTCYRTQQAIAFEAGDVSQARPILGRPAWAGPDPRVALETGTAVFDAPAGAGELVEAWRG